jgi:hypothetical protein
MTSTLILPFAKAVEFPENLHRVKHVDNEAAAAETVETWKPAEPPPPPAAVVKLQERAALAEQAAANARAEAEGIAQAARSLGQEIIAAESNVKVLTQRLAALEGLDFKKQSADAEIEIEAALVSLDYADPQRHADRTLLVMLRGERLEEIRQRALKKVRAELSLAKRTLMTLNESK